MYLVARPGKADVIGPEPAVRQSRCPHIHWHVPEHHAPGPVIEIEPELLRERGGNVAPEKFNFKTFPRRASAEGPWGV